MLNDIKNRCPLCNKVLDENENLIEVGKGIDKRYMCEECYEVDDTPTTKYCDHCNNIATTCICGTNLCDDCLEHYHY